MSKNTQKRKDELIENAYYLLGNYSMDAEMAISVIDEMISMFEKHPEIDCWRLPFWKANRDYLKRWKEHNGTRFEEFEKNYDTLYQ